MLACLAGPVGARHRHRFALRVKFYPPEPPVASSSSIVVVGTRLLYQQLKWDLSEGTLKAGGDEEARTELAALAMQGEITKSCTGT